MCFGSINLVAIDLLPLYKQFYPKKSNALQHVMQHLNIAQFFFEPLSEKELLCLLHMKPHQTYKNVARSMHLSIKTIETHIAHIQNKLKAKSIADILAFLRNYQGNRYAN